MDWNVIAQYLPLYKKAAWLTLRLGLAGIVIAIVVGLVCALVQYYKVPVHQDQRRNLRYCGSGVPGRQLHGGGVPQRVGIH